MAEGGEEKVRLSVALNQFLCSFDNPEDRGEMGEEVWGGGRWSKVAKNDDVE